MPKIIYAAELSADAPFTTNGLLAFDEVIKSVGPVIQLEDGIHVEVVVDGPLAINLAVKSLDSAPFDLALLKNGEAFRYIAEGVTSSNTTIIDADAKREDQYSVQVGLQPEASATIDHRALFTNLTIAGL